MFRLRLAPLALVLSLLPAVAAAEPTAAEIALARRLFSEARGAEDAGNWKLASTKLRDAIAIKETPGLRFHLAFCEEQLGMLVEAMVDYDRADEALRAAPKSGDDVAKQLGPKRDALRKRIPTITVSLPPDVASATLSLDGHLVSAALFRKPIPENPGAHHVVVTAPGREPFTRDLTLNEGDAVVATAVLPLAGAAPIPASAAGAPPSAPDPAPAPAADRAAAPSSPVHARTWVLVAEGAVTAISLGVGVGFTMSASSADGRADDARTSIASSAPNPDGACTAPTPSVASTCDDLSKAVSDAKSDRGIATAGFVGAGVGAAAFAATWFFWPKAPAATHAFHVVPSMTAHGDGSLLVTGLF